jgi:hypothetical protein
MGSGRRTAFVFALGLVDTAVTSPLAPRTGRGRPWGSAAGHSFVPTVRGAWWVPATARRAALSSPASPDGGHVDLRAGAVAVSEPCSTGLPGEAADLAVAQPVEDEAEQFPGRGTPSTAGGDTTATCVTTRSPSLATVVDATDTLNPTTSGTDTRRGSRGPGTRSSKPLTMSSGSSAGTVLFGVLPDCGPNHAYASQRGLPRDPVTSDLWCREVPLEGCSLCPSPIPGSSGRT